MGEDHRARRRVVAVDEIGADEERDLVRRLWHERDVAVDEGAPRGDAAPARRDVAAGREDGAGRERHDIGRGRHVHVRHDHLRGLLGAGHLTDERRRHRLARGARPRRRRDGERAARARHAGGARRAARARRARGARHAARAARAGARRARGARRAGRPRRAGRARGARRARSAGARRARGAGARRARGAGLAASGAGRGCRCRRRSSSLRANAVAQRMKSKAKLVRAWIVPPDDGSIEHGFPSAGQARVRFGAPAPRTVHQGATERVIAEAPVAQQDHAMREGARKLLVVRHAEQREPFGAQPAQQRDELADALTVERARGLVHEQRLGREREGARDRGALLLAARQLVRARVGARRDAAALEQRARLPRRLVGPAARHVDGRLDDVLEHREVREEVPLLEHEPDAAAHARDRAVVVGRPRRERVVAHAHRARVGGLETVEAAQQRRLADARGTHDGDGLARVDAQRDAVEQRARAQPLRESDGFDHRARRAVTPRPAGVP